MDRPSGPLGKKPNINAYSDMLKEMKKKYQPKAYAKSEAVKKSREDYRNSPEASEKFKDMASYTPLFPLVTGKNMYDAYQKGDTNEMIAEGLAGTVVGLGSMVLPPLAIKGVKKGYQGLEKLFKGPLSPQYNSNGGAIYAAKGAGKEIVKNFISKFFDHPMNETIRKNKPEFKDLDIYYTGQNPAVAKQMQEGKTKGDVYFSDNPEVAKVYAGPDGVVMGFGAQTPIGGKRSIIDKNMGYAGGQTQYILSPEEAIEFMKNPKAGPMPFSIFSNPQLTRR